MPEPLVPARCDVAQKEALLAQSGFKVITVTTPKQQQAMSGLAQGRVSAVKYNKKTVLRVSHCDEGQDLRRETSPIQQRINRRSQAHWPAIQRPRRRLRKVTQMADSL